jgi:hypothetical protein
MSVCINEKDHTCQVISAHIVAVMTAPYVMRAVKKGHYIPTPGKECSTENPAWWSQSCNRDWKGHGGRDTLNTKSISAQTCTGSLLAQYPGDSL